MKMIKTGLKVLAGLALVPFALAASVAAYDAVGGIRLAASGQTMFLWGIGAYLLNHLFFFRAQYLYVLAHEATHAVFGLLCGARVSSFRVSSRGGSVRLSKSNFFIDLGPYFFPAYTILVFLAFGLMKLFKPDLAAGWSNAFLFLAGFSLAFHFVMTGETLRVEQPDLKQNGYLFSLPLIYVVNVLILMLCLAAVFDDIRFLEFLRTAIQGSGNILLAIGRQLFRT